MSQAQEIDNIQEKLNWHWRNTMQTVRFFAFDARAALPLPLLLVYFRWSTLILMLGTLFFFRFLEQKGLTVPSAIRSFRSWFVGANRPGWDGIRRKKFNDFG
ncbi:MAG: IcmT/TraK family protein [Bdellovibrionales bacterium]